MTSLTEYVRRSDELVVEGKLAVYFEDGELYGWLQDQQDLAAELAPRTDTAIGRFMDPAQKPGFSANEP